MGRIYSNKVKFLVCGSTLVFLLGELAGFYGLFNSGATSPFGHLTPKYPYPGNHDVPDTKNLKTAAAVLEKLYNETSDLDGVVDLNKSRIFILGNKTVYGLGEEIKLRIVLYDREGNRRRKGGDLIKVRMFEDRLDASATGHVTGHGTGSHTATLLCLWVGDPKIQVYLYYTREISRIFDGVLESIPTLRHTLAVFKNNRTTRCHPFKRWLNRSLSICNLTKQNGGMSWYCETPEKGNYSCRDLLHFDKGHLNRFLRLKKIYAKSSRGCFNQEFHINVKASDTEKTDCTGECSKNRVYSKRPAYDTPNCSRFDRIKLWNLKYPTGYFYQNTWYMLHCKQPSLTDLKTVLKDKHLVMYGDSTVRQWFVELKERFKCELTTKQWTKTKWKLDSTVYCFEYNLTIDLVFHAFPGNVDETRIKINSIARHLGYFHNEKDVAFLIFIGSHFNVYHKDVFLDRINKIGRSIERLMKTNPSANVFVKGSHTFWSTFDYKAEVYRSIKEKAFTDIKDKVTYLDNEDLTSAKLVKNPHPQPIVVRAMVDQLLAYFP